MKVARLWIGIGLCSLWVAACHVAPDVHDGVLASFTGTFDEECELSCDDGDACTTDSGMLVDGECVCGSLPVTEAVDGDGCCLDGDNNNTDSDCAPVCGNGVTEAGEGCDDGGFSCPVEEQEEGSGEGGDEEEEEECVDECPADCQYEPTAFRVTELVLRDPHAFAGALFFCVDATGQTNDQIANRINSDTDDDGNIDLSLALVFRPLDQGADSTTLEFHVAECSAEEPTCSAGPKNVSGPVSNEAEGTCLSAHDGTTDYSPAPSEPEGPCFVSEPQALTVELAGLPITLQDAQVAATYVDEPASSLSSGLIMGFLSEEDAENIVIPDDVPFVGGEPLAALFPGGQDNCSSDDARDIGPDGATSGWWIYLDFQAQPVDWTVPAPEP